MSGGEAVGAGILEAERSLAATRYPIEELEKAVSRGRRVVVQGPNVAYLALVLGDFVERRPRPVAVVLPTAADARAMDGAIRALAPGLAAVLLPPPEVSPYAGVSPDRPTTMARMAALDRASRLAAGHALVTCALGWARRSTPRSSLEQARVSLAVDGDVDLVALRRALEAGGYSEAGLVEDEGTFSIRGDIVDVFPAGSEEPVRVELYGDMIETIRTFDPVSQRSREERTALECGPALEEVFTAEALAAARERLGDLGAALKTPSSRVGAVLRDLQAGKRFFGVESLLPAFAPALESVAERLPEDTLIVVVEPELGCAEVDRWLDARRAEYEREVDHGELVFPIEESMLDEARYVASLERAPRVDVAAITEGVGAADVLAFPCLANDDVVRVRKQRAGGDGAVHAVFDIVEGWREHYGRVVFACGTRGTADRVAGLLRGYGADVDVAHGGADLSTPAVGPCERFDVVVGSLVDGFRSPGRGLAVLTDREVLGRSVRRAGRELAHEATAIASFRELAPGDLVVHIDFGVGRYAGLMRMDTGGVDGDFLALDYADGDRLYVPVYRLGRVQRYVGSPTFTRLDKLGGTTWEKTKEKVKRQLADIADELLRLQAQRASAAGFAFSPPDDLFRELEAEFPYEETPHQEQAIDDVVGDMTVPRPMDRLLCGDVGFGKTEVAIRAAYKAVLDGRQVAVLVPTTVLAEQHLKSFRQRLRHAPVRVEALSRFRTAAQAKAIVADTQAGKVDILIGTHRLLSKDIAFREIGLLVVDEEQRFGVTHKERIKQFRSNVDVLTMTATPIPRTLEMAMLGIRDLSVILTPPPGRLAVRTHIARFKDAVIQEAVDHELKRGGQVFFVHNRVETIYNIADELRRIVPEARVGVSHAQMKDGELEDVMLQFLNREVDVLVTTTIIESGIDISTANTMFVNQADNFGLSQLHQLRGRVGRGSVRAYCYLLVKDPRRLTPEARRRLEVLQQHTDLGAGIQIAQQDLDMRGAGNLLGRNQSGHIEAIGFELYAELLDEAVAELKGQAAADNYEPDVKIPVAAFIPEEYIADISQRLIFYKRYSLAATIDELYDVHGELQERYGSAPEPVNALRDIVVLKLEMRRIRARSIEAGPRSVVVELLPDTTLEPDRVIELIQTSGGAYEFRPEMTLVRTLKGQEATDILATALRVSREVGECLA